MPHNFTLPVLQASMDRLPLGRSITLARTQVDRLFGINDASAARVKRFARAHSCVVAHTDDCVVFHKVPPFGHHQRAAAQSAE